MSMLPPDKLSPLEKARARPGRITAERGSSTAANPGEFFTDEQNRLWWMFGATPVCLWPPLSNQSTTVVTKTGGTRGVLPVQAFWSGPVVARLNAFVWYAPETCRLTGVTARLAQTLAPGVLPLNLNVRVNTKAFVVTIMPGQDRADVPLDPIMVATGDPIAIDVLQAISVTALSVQLR